MAKVAASLAGHLGAEHSRITSDRFNPVYIWSSIGLLFVVLNLYLYVSWFTGPYFKTVPMGPDEPPLYVWAMVWFMQILGPTLFVGIVYWFIYKPWRRTGKLSFDGMIVIASLFMYWQNVAGNFFVNPVVLLNAAFINHGSFYMYIPGWVSPNMDKTPESLLAWLLCYPTWAVFLPMILGAKLMRLIKARYPHFTGWQLFFSIYVVAMVLDFVMELVFLYTQMYQYATTIPALTLFAGETYQFPVYEIVGWGMSLSLYASFYYYRDDKGYTYVDRGVQQLRVSDGIKTALRVLSFVAFLNIVFLAFSTGPVLLGGTFGGPTVKGYPSYLMTGQCGPGTNYDCPGPGVPMPRQDSPTNRIAIDSTPIKK